MNPDESGQILTDTDSIFRALKALELNRSPIGIRFSNSRKTTHNSLILDVSQDTQSFVLDELTPDDGGRRLGVGEPFTLSGNYDGIHTMIKDIRVNAAQRQPDGTFRIKFPKSLYYRQRRQSFRAPVGRGIKAMAQLKSSKREQELSAHITNLSPNGIGCRFSGFVKPNLTKGEMFELCHLNINGNFDMHCALITKHPHYDRITDTTHCGFEFNQLTPHQQKSVNRYVLELQRLQRRTTEASYQRASSL